MNYRIEKPMRIPINAVPSSQRKVIGGTLKRGGGARVNLGDYALVSVLLSTL